MTIQLQSSRFGKNKATLQGALNARPADVQFEDPSIFPESRGVFWGSDVKPGERFPVVMDPQTRRRFATVQRLANGEFRVK